MRALVLAALLACGDNELVDDGFGEPCESILDGRIYTTCESADGIEGICAVGVCRRFCAQDSPRCPPSQAAIPTVANQCWCEPR